MQMFTFRYIGYFDSDKPILKGSDYANAPAVPNVSRRLPRAVFDDALGQFPVDPASLKWYYGAIMSFLSLPGEIHPFERTLIETAKCSVLNMRLDVIYLPDTGLIPLTKEVWTKEDYLLGRPSISEMHWCDVFYKRLVCSDDPDDQIMPSLQGQLLSAITKLEYEMASMGQIWDDAVDVFHAYEEFVLSHLSDGTFDARAIEIACRAMTGLNKWMNREKYDSDQVLDDLDATLLLTYHWCRLHPRPLPPATVMWESSN